MLKPPGNGGGGGPLNPGGGGGGGGPGGPETKIKFKMVNFFLRPQIIYLSKIMEAAEAVVVEAEVGQVVLNFNQALISRHFKP